MSSRTFKIFNQDLEQLKVIIGNKTYDNLEIIELKNAGETTEVWRKAYPCKITVDSTYLSKITVKHNESTLDITESDTIYIPVSSTSTIAENVLTITCENGDSYVITAVAKASDYTYKYYFDSWVYTGAFGKEACTISTTGHLYTIPTYTVTFVGDNDTSWLQGSEPFISCTVKEGAEIGKPNNWVWTVTDIANGDTRASYSATFKYPKSDAELNTGYYIYTKDSQTVTTDELGSTWPITVDRNITVRGSITRTDRTFGVYLGTHTYDYIGYDWGDLTNGNTIEGWDAWQALETSCWDNNAEGTDIATGSFLATDVITIKRTDLASTNNVSYVKVERNGAIIDNCYWTITKNADLAVHGLASFHLNGNNKNEILAGDENCDAMITGEFGALWNEHNNGAWFTSANKLDIYAYIGPSAQWHVIRGNSSGNSDRYNGNSDINNSLTAYTCNVTLDQYPSESSYPIIVKFDWLNNVGGGSNSRGWVNLACAPYAIDKENAEIKLQEYDDTLSMKLWANRGNKKSGWSGGARLLSATVAQRKY